MPERGELTWLNPKGASCALRWTELGGAREVSEREQTGQPAVLDHERASNPGLSELLQRLARRLVLGDRRNLVARSMQSRTRRSSHSPLGVWARQRNGANRR